MWPPSGSGADSHQPLEGAVGKPEGLAQQAQPIAPQLVVGQAQVRQASFAVKDRGQDLAASSCEATGVQPAGGSEESVPGASPLSP